MLLLNLLVFILILGAIIAIHELGHLIFAKRAKILCYEYSLGFGPALYKRKSGETEFSVRAIPLGGFVSMAGEQISTEMIKEEQIIGLNLEDGKIKEIVLSEQIKAQIVLKVTKFEVYDEEKTGYLFIEGLVDGNLEHFEILEDAFYIISEKQKLQIAPYDRCFESKSFLQKFLTLIAGPGMNFLLAVLLFMFVVVVQGKPQNTNVIGEVVSGSPASVSGLKAKDKIVSVGGVSINTWDDLKAVYENDSSYENVEVIVSRQGEELIFNVDFAVDIVQLGISNYSKDGVLTSLDGAVVGNAYNHASEVLKEGDIIIKVKYLDNEEKVINNWHDIISVVNELDGEELEVTYIRDEQTFTKKIQVWELKVLKSQGVSPYNVFLGVNPERKFSLSYTLTEPFVRAWNSFYQVIATVGLLFGGSSQVGVNDLSGPVGIFNIVGQIMRQGPIALVAFTAFLSVNIGVLNLLPIPALDGGRILFISYEGVTRKKISRKFENTVNNVFFFLLMALFLYVTINDVLRLF